MEHSNMKNNFIEFLNDKSAEEMYITGRAGTGKTTILRDIVEYLMQENIPYIVCAYTHKACGILREKLPQDAAVFTLDAFLLKRPGINTDANNVRNVDITVQLGLPEKPKVLLIDEFSMVGEKDLERIRELFDEDEETGMPVLKVVWIGEKIQLPPVGDCEAVFPEGDYNFELTKRYRQSSDNELINTIDDIAAFIEGTKKMSYLEPNNNYIREADIVEAYKQDDCQDKIILCYTNKQVQYINRTIEGKSWPDMYDRVFSPNTKHHYQFIQTLDRVPYLDRAFGKPLEYGTKYRTLENLPRIDGITFCECVDEDNETWFFAIIFGHSDYQQRLQELKSAAVNSNIEIEKTFDMKASAWAKFNQDHPLAMKRRIAWAQFLSFNENVICMDFAHATTVHKSQGSTFTNVYVDDEDIALCYNRDKNLFLRLKYVAYSRASNKVWSNS